MRIIKLQAENVKKIRAIEITPTGDIVTISGKNGSGKTSTLDSIWWALAGTRHIQGEPIRKGETKARIKLDLGEIVVERKFTATDSTLSVESADGARYPTPQKMLDALLGELSFDPLAFARMDPRKQFDELRRVAKLELDIDKLNGLNAADYAKRTDINRDAKAKRAQADGVSVPPVITEQAIDEAALVDELQLAGEMNTQIEAQRQKRERAAATVAQRRKDADSAKAHARKMLADGQAEYDAAMRAAEAALERAKEASYQFDADAKTATDDADAIEKKLLDAPALPDPTDVSMLLQKIEAARINNKALADHETAQRRKQALTEDAKTLEAESRAITERMEAREQAKRGAIANAAIPVPGLGFGDGVVTFNGIPFDQASSAEQLRVSMAIAMAANPKLRVIRIVDGSLLDEDSLAAIGEMAKADDFQVWIETVSSSGKVGVVIDDGAVASTPESRGELTLEQANA